MTAADLVRNPAFETSERGGTDCLVNRVEGTVVRLTPEVAAVLARHGEPLSCGTAPRTATGAGDAHHDLVARLARLRVLVPRRDAETARRGLARKSDHPIGPIWLRSAPRKTDWVVIGCPVAAGARPARDPATGTALVRAGLARRTATDAAPCWSWESGRKMRLGGTAYDFGDIIYTEGTDTVALVHDRVWSATRQVADAGCRPLLIGGDHSLTYPSVTALRSWYTDLRVLHLDAHADRLAIGEGRTAHCGDFVSWLIRDFPDLPVMTVGVRGFDSGFDPEAPGAVTYVTARDVGEGAAVEAVRAFCSMGPLYITVDVDVLDPAVAPEVAYPVVSGLWPHEAGMLLDAAAESTDVVGADFVEVCESSGRRNSAATAQVRLITALLEITTSPVQGGGTR